MSMTRFFQWTCDYCGWKVDIEAHGGPAGWTWGRKLGPKEGISHRCDSCTEHDLEQGRIKLDPKEPKRFIEIPPEVPSTPAEIQ